MKHSISGYKHYRIIIYRSANIGDLFIELHSGYFFLGSSDGNIIVVVISLFPLRSKGVKNWLSLKQGTGNGNGNGNEKQGTGNRES